MEKHTPLPWRVIDVYSHGKVAIGSEHTRGLISDCIDGRTKDEAEANTMLIVHRVNTYPQLVEALKAAARHLPSPTSLPRTQTQIGDDLHLVMDALEIAEGK